MAALSRREFKKYTKAQRKIAAALDKLADERRKLDRRALKLNAVEMKRRLKALNGEQARIAKSQSLSVSAELYGADKEASNRRVNALERSENERSGALRMLTLLAGSGAVSGIIGLVWLLVSSLRTSGVPAPMPTPPVYIPSPAGALLPSAPQTAPVQR